MAPPAIHLATTDAEILACLPVLRELRPHLTGADILPRIRAQQAQGFLLASLAAAGTITTVAGFRLQHMLVSGLTLYVDDLVTAASVRSRGHGSAMLAWLAAYGREHHCQTLSLDSGTHRQDAHAFYLRERLRITSFHFQRTL